MSNKTNELVQQVDALRTALMHIEGAAMDASVERRAIRDAARAALAAQPAAERVGLTEAEFMRVLNKLGPDMHGRVALTYESGPYDINKPTNVAMRLLRGIEAAHRITATSGKESGNG